MMREFLVRRALPVDAERLAWIAEAAFRTYLPRMDRPPAPMLADYGAHIEAGEAFVLESSARIEAFIVLVPQSDYLLLDIIAVAPECQKMGFGRQLARFAESRARELGYKIMKVYTNVAMRENLAWYEALGYRETGRFEQDGYKRIWFSKDLE